ncbi:MAG: hypothetical protein ABI629_18055 [bacterium]
MIYRRHRGQQDWHACANCTAWPHLDFEETAVDTTAAPRCVVCEMKLEVGTCTAQD